MNEKPQQIEKLISQLQTEKNQTVHLAAAVSHLTNALANLATHVKKTTAPPITHVCTTNP